MHHTCSLCGSNHTVLHCTVKQRAYYSCTNCRLVFVPELYHLKPAQEKAIYDLHQNNPDDQGYRQFLNRLMTPLIAQLQQFHATKALTGLDFGSGPGPTLATMLQEQGYATSIYDPFYAPDTQILENTFDFITSTEVWEHLASPGTVIKKLFSMLNPGGIIGVMTKRIPDTAFEHWHYIKDPTHITFFHDESFAYIASHYQCTLKLISQDVALFIRE